MSEPSEQGVALVTGAAQAVGMGIARALAEAGYRVGLADIDAEGAGRSAASLRGASAHRLDVTEADDWARVVAEVADRWGRLDVLVNNAGISPRGTAESTDEA